MKKFLYVLLGAAGALLVRSILDRRSRTVTEGALPRPIPAQFDGEVYSVEDEVSGPLAEV
jgi:hypothetical protein